MQSTTDTEVILHLVAQSKRNRFIDRFIEALRAIEGAYSLVSLTNKKLIGARDPLGIRPLVLGELDGCPILASETCALDIIGAKYVRDIDAGEVIVFDEHGAQSHKPFPPKPPRPCIFEYIYFSRPDSIVGGRSVYEVRKAFGAQLARESHVEVDVVVPVPDSGVPAAIGYSQHSGVPFELGIIRNHYVGRTFIQPTQSVRELGVRMKHSANRAAIEGKRIILIDEFAGARHHLEEDRAHDARRRRARSAFPPRLAADPLSRLLRHRPARPRRPAGRDPYARRDARDHRRGFAGVPVDRRHVPRDGRARPRSRQSEILGSLFYRRLSDPPDRPDPGRSRSRGNCRCWRKRARQHRVVPANAGTHNPWRQWFETELVANAPSSIITLTAYGSLRSQGRRLESCIACPFPSPPASLSSPAPRAASAMPPRCALAKAGAHIVAVARTQGGLEELDDEIRKDGGSATLVPLNLTDFEGIARLGAALHERHGKLDILVGNAGVAGPSSPLGHIELKPWTDVMAINVTANFQLIRCMEPLLRQSDAGRAVFVTSAASNKALAYLGPYSASKAALEALVRVWANETAIDADPGQPVQPRPDPHPDARRGVSRRRPDDARHAGTGRGIHRADVRAVLDRDRQILRLQDPHAAEFSRAGVIGPRHGHVGSHSQTIGDPLTPISLND